MGRFLKSVLQQFQGVAVHSTWARLAMAGAATAIALLFTSLLWPTAQAPLLLFVAAVVITALLAGFEAALAATAFSLLCILLFLAEPAFSLAAKDLRELARIGVFAAVSLLLAWLVGRMAEVRRLLAKTVSDKTQLASVLAQLASIVESSNDAIFSKTLGGIITTWNHAAEEMYGYTAEEAIGRHVSILIPAEFASEELHILELVGRGQKTPRYDTLRLRKDGSRVRLSLVVSPLRDEHGAVVGASSIARDITEERAREEALRHREAELRTLTEAIPQIVWRATTDGASHYFNARWYEYTGVSKEEALGWGWQPVLHPDDLPECLQRWRDALRTGDNFEMEYRLRRRDGSYRWHLGRAVAMRGHQGKIVEWFGTLTDIHDYKLAQAMLVTTEKDAAMGRMAGSIAHEINNPLAAISNLVVLLSKKEQKDFEARYYLQMLSDEVARVVRITRQTLGFYQESQSPVAVNLCSALRDVLAVHAKEIMGHEITVEKQFAEDIQVNAFPSDIRHLLSNLVLNAIEAVGSGGIIRLDVGMVEESAENVRIVISDNGPGIPAAIADKIFEPFFSTKGEKGTGLGLWVCRGIVERHGGELRFASSTDAQNHGTAFTVILPKTWTGPRKKVPGSKRGPSSQWRASA